MDTYNDLLIQAIAENDVPRVHYCLRKGANVNAICSGGFTPLGAAVLGGNLITIKLLAESTKTSNVRCLDINDEDCSRPLFLTLDVTKADQKYKNIGYFVVCKDLDDTDFGDGPTPDGMEALEWDMEISTDDCMDDVPSPPESSLYKWYAKILTQTSIILKSPEYDMGRLDGHGQNVLHYAVRQGNVEVVEYLLDNYVEINVNQCDSAWLSPLHLAIMQENIGITNFLLEKGANVNPSNPNVAAPLHIASQIGNADIVQLLLKRGADVNLYDMEDRSALTHAILHEHEEIASLLIKRGTRLNHEETYGYTVLYHAVWNNMYNAAKELLEAGAKIIQSHYLLHIAIRHGNFDIVKLLCQAGAIINIRDDQGNTPLMVACINQNLQIAKYLLRNGAPVNTTNHINGMTALHLCVQAVREPTLFEQFFQLLLSHRVNMNANSYQGNVLFYAIILGNLTAACVLIRHGADVNLRDEHAYFDNLCLAKKHGNLELVMLIVYAGFAFKNMLFDVKTLKAQSEDPVFEFLLYATSGPLNLRELCRIKIRKRLGGNLVRKIYQLPLPSLIHRYLALDIL